MAFAQKIGVAQSTVAGWEAGKREPNFQTLMKLADFFHVSIDYLLGHSDCDGITCEASSCWDGHHIQELRKQRKETPEAVAKSIGISVEHYKKYESAAQDPPVSVLHKLADHFCCQIDILLDYVWGMYDSSDHLITGDFTVKDKEEQQLVEYFRLLERENKKTAIGFIQGMLAIEVADREKTADAG